MKQPLFKKILYATDLSQTAKQAARYALSLAHEYGAELTVINVIPDLVEEMSAGMGYDLVSHFGREKLSTFYTEGLEESRKSVIARIHSVCAEAGSELENCAVEPKVVVKVGHPVEQIVQTAIEGGFDLVVLGTHGHSMIDDLLLGSVARGVVKKNPMPVLTVRLKE
ncbi:MAG: universal stress protein [Proteobacteria bacterium]|jgi:nucleotide-binding universal stress UspA family protein|nr:universal stress protein [Desulfocapsa sp.]MBU3945747.1 universal stress protein [Pseudomonadota bacterium]MCG2745393.1 universal stress protein [Desulfobacteraceae bacterium]MBU3983240.1 universal stress protein [Pseudomonadota bacterium]MBU4030039.1 universal stress protein [Pseudomonadota bacterium]